MTSAGRAWYNPHQKPATIRSDTINTVMTLTSPDQTHKQQEKQP